ncbi:MAG: M15 family metallopeptidase [Cryobacterium sp.]|nr:M15 family metallopeptidase [Cryobacterium sp.]MBX3089607.1 M15 family metallopeptidase [Cryobacterium sp.]MCO5294873.1 M15 family metallopeptidase [Homoserinimonas sp.]MCW5944264.1 M15 family metallopeptidase [Cryobacterium sp.]
MPGLNMRRVVAALVAGAVVVSLAACAPERVPVAPATTAPVILPSPIAKVKSFFDKHKYSIDDPLSIWVINDKLRPLNPINYAPPDMVQAKVRSIFTPLMRPEAAAAIEKMFAAAKAEGAGEMLIQNSYRSYQTQVNVHQNWVNQLGEKGADAQSARAGYSEHQTGWTADVGAYPAKCSITQCFGDTPQGKWLAANAWRFGFVIRYPEGKQDVTGYIYEPWHVRYVGTYLSTEMHETGILTLEEFFDLPPAPDYAN